MSNAPSDDAVQLVSGLLAHIKQIVGDGASYAMLHYGAVEEGKRLGQSYSPQELAKMLERLDALFSHRSEIVKDDGASVTVRVHSSPLLKTGHRSVQGIVVGLLEGTLSSSRKGRYKASLLPATSKDELTIELKREG